MSDLTAPSLKSVTFTNSTANASAVNTSADIVLTFSEAMTSGTGLITISDGATQTYMGKDGTLRTRLVGATDTRTVDISDTSQVTVSGDTVTINLASDLKAGKSYSVQMGKGVLLDEAGNAYAGLSDTTKLKFTTSAATLPTAVVDSTFTITDTGSSASDFITSSAVQTIAGKVNGALLAGEAVMVSLDNGGTWAAATVNAADSTWSIGGTVTGSSTIIARVVNAEGNASAAARHAYTFDTDAPTVGSIAINDTDLVAGETATVTVTFNEAVTGLDVSDFTVEGGALSSLATADNGKTWTATLTPTKGVSTTTGTVTLNAGSVADLAGNSGPANSSSKPFNYSTVPDAPTATVTSISMTDTGSSATDFITNSTSQTIKGTYSGTLAADEYIQVSLDNGSTWTKATVSGSNWEVAGATISASNTLKARVFNDYTYSNPMAQAYTLDQTAPTATVTLDKAHLKKGETATITITFSEAVTGLTSADIKSNDTVGTPVSTDGGVTWTATLTPTNNGNGSVTLYASSVTDLAGNSGPAADVAATYSSDLTRPTATISLADSALTAGETTLVTITFSEAVTEFTNADLTVGNGTLSTVTSTDGGTTWTATLTPTASTTATTNVITLDNTAVSDLAGNTGIGSTSSANYSVSTVRPTATINIADTALTAGETTTVTFTFSSAVTGFDASDVTVANGTISTPTTTDNITWTATLTPSASTEDTTNVITLANTGFHNSAGNSGTGTTTSGNYTVDTARPTATISLADTALTVGETTTVTVKFSEAVTGFSASSLSVANGTISSLTSSDNITWTGTLTPTASQEDSTNVITLNNSGVSDAAGNTGSGTTTSANYTVDTLRPTATISLADSALTAGETTTVSITFSEVVTGLTTADLTVANGTLTSLQSSDGMNWTATLTPSASTDDTTNVITLDNTGITDASGNAGSGTTTSANYTVATVRPTATIAVSDTALKTGDTATVTITFSEAVTGLTAADFTVANGTLSTPTTTDNITWTATLTPTSSIEDTTNVITLDNTGVTDSDGNTGSGTTSSSNYTVDTKAPTATIALSQPELLTGETSTVTITFNEAVTGLTLADFKYSGTMTAPVSTDGGTTWVATLTPSTESSSGEVRLNTSSVTDSAGNSGPSSEAYASFTYNAAPTATIATASITDTGTSGDFITSSTSQEISGTLSAALGRGQYVQVSLDNGESWTTATTIGTGWSLSGQTISHSSTLKVRATNGSSTSTTYSHSYTLDQAAPTAPTITLSKDALYTNQTATVTVVFDEAVYGLTASDFTISGGTLGTFSTSDNLTWTATLTPTATGSLALAASSVYDTAGNVGPTSASSSKSFTFTADTTGPTATLTLNDNTLGKGGTATLTVTLSEAVTDTPTASDFTVSGGSLGTFTSTDSGLTWTATLTPTDSAYGAGTISLSANAISDQSGNTGPSSAASLPFYYDTQALTLSSSIAFSTDSGESGSDLITNTGTQTISGTYSGGTIYSTMGDKIEVSTDNGSTWSEATVSGQAWSISKTLSGSDTIQVRLTDGTGVAGTPVSHTYTIDTTSPGSMSSKIPDLASSSDTSNGVSGGTSDDITSNTTPVITYSLYNSGLTAGDYVDVYDTTTSTILHTHTITSSELTSYGGTVSATVSELSAGSHSLVLRSRDAAGNTGTQSQALALTIDTSAISMAGKTVDLAASSDSGTSSTDNITNNSAPTVTVNVANTSGLVAGDKLQIIDSSNGDAVVGTYTLTSTDFSSSGADINITLSTLTDGTHALALRVYDRAGNTGTASSATSITIDTIAPSLSSSTPSSSSTSNSVSTSSVTLVFSEALADVNSRTGFKVTDGANDAREITGEALSGNTLSYDSSTHTATLSLSGSLQYASTYTVYVYNAALSDTAGNSVAIDTALLSFSTESVPTPSAVTLAMTESTYASHTGTDNDHITNNATLCVSGITAAYLRYKLTSNAGWTTVQTSGSTYSIPLSDDTYAAGVIQVEQYDTAGYESTAATLSDSWTVDTSSPSGRISTSTSGLPSFTGLGINTAISTITGSVSGEFNLDDEFIEYTTDSGSTWTKASAMTAFIWTIADVKVAAGGEIGFRASDKAGNIGYYGETSNYTVYVGDDSAGNHTATGSKYLYTQAGNDTIDITGASNAVHAGSGNDAININSASTTNHVYGDGGSDTINVNGSHNSQIEGGADADTITVTGSYNYVYGNDGDDTLSISGTYNTVYGDNSETGDTGADTITVSGSSNTVDAGPGANSITVTGADNTVTGGSDTDTISVSSTGNTVYGGDSADTITVATSGNTIYGEAGADQFTVAALGSNIYGGDGSDTFTVTASLAGTLSGLIDGGTDGTDVLNIGVSSQTLSLSTLTSNIAHIEKISLGTSNTLTISGAAIQTMSDTDSIRFEGDSTDTIYYDSSLWESATWIQILGYNKYQLKSDTTITFIIDSDIHLYGLTS
ncbi:hypothetical protein GCM10027277_38260 [Pseudoduganella ginsengisoli]|uniref:DUF3060 domain-containing protein n=1 Tax=Pseudoduganella ginsengisoli TaxID=1462440 RepID=A0A6L6Q985_9BURK|nr:Ig-like domain-containing protein [Pseudoduganella ginsengisoli]MTW05996.1 DUF3060 domain-containing protein [Pseudoduganella ginsengisoli]